MTNPYLELADRIMKGKVDKAEFDALLNSPLPSAEYSEAFGHLKLVSEHKRQKVTVYRGDCYICIDPDYRLYGLPFCHQCPKCKGHIAADDTICDDCGYEVTMGPDEEPGQGIKCPECDSWTWSGVAHCRNCRADVTGGKEN